MSARKLQDDDDGDLESLEVWRGKEDEFHLAVLYKERELMQKALTMSTLEDKARLLITKKVNYITEEIEILEKTKALYEIGVL